MKHRKWIYSLTGPLFLFCSAMLFAPAQQAAAQDLGVVVLRGVSPVAGNESIDATREWEVTVVRGRPAPTPPPVPETRPEQNIEAVVGFNGWFIDNANNRIVNCFRINTTEVGGSRIKCVSRRL